MVLRKQTKDLTLDTQGYGELLKHLFISLTVVFIKKLNNYIFWLIQYLYYYYYFIRRQLCSFIELIK